MFKIYSSFIMFLKIINWEKGKIVYLNFSQALYGPFHKKDQFHPTDPFHPIYLFIPSRTTIVETAKHSFTNTPIVCMCPTTFFAISVRINLCGAPIFTYNMAISGTIIIRFPIVFKWKLTINATERFATPSFGTSFYKLNDRSIWL